MYYPLTHVATLPEVSSATVLQTLIGTFREQGHPNLPLISHIPVQAFGLAEMPDYLMYALATLGAVTSREDLSTTHALWTASNSLIASTLEVDNREARNVGLINAVRESPSYGARRHWSLTDNGHSGYFRRRMVLYVQTGLRGNRLTLYTDMWQQ
jgi:hypothetical protein